MTESEHMNVNNVEVDNNKKCEKMKNDFLLFCENIFLPTRTNFHIFKEA